MSTPAAYILRPPSGFPPLALPPPGTIAGPAGTLAGPPAQRGGPPGTVDGLP